MTQQEATEQITQILAQFKGKGEVSFDGDTRGADEIVCDIVKEALEHLDVDGLGGCRLCAS